MTDTETGEPIAIYLHGLPGGPGEPAALGLSPPMVALDRLMLAGPKDDFATRLERFAEAARATAAGRPIRLVGFSLGARIALELALRLGEQVVDIRLISAAAPLEWLPPGARIAGRVIFRLARLPAPIVSLATGLNARLAARLPERFFDMIFAEVRGADVDLARTASFRSAVVETARRCMGPGRAGYVAELKAYVPPWSLPFERIRQPVEIFHGREDNWTPVEMAEGLARRLLSVRRVELFDGLSHYSTLRHVLSRADF